MAIAVVAVLSAASTTASGLTFPLQARWTSTLPDGPAFPPAYDADHGYFSLHNNQLIAIALKDGATAWSVECPTATAPAAGGGLVFVGRADHVEARSQADGASRWRLPVAEPVASLLWDAGWLLIAVGKGPLLAVRAEDGEMLWQRDLGAPLQSPPALAGDRIYVATQDGRIVALSLGTGEILWSQQLAQPGAGILAMEDRLFVGSQDDYLYCLDTKDGKRKWRWRNGADVVGTPVLDARRVYFVAYDNVLRALSRQNGSLQWKQGLPMRPPGGPLLSGDTLIVFGLAAELHAFTTPTGKPAGDFALRGAQGEEMQLAAPPHVTLEQVIIATKNGQVQALASAAPP